MTSPPPEPARATPAGWRIARVGGVPVVVGGGWLVIAIIMVVLFGPQLADELPTLGGWAYAVAVAYALLLLVSVLVHEASHAVVAHLCGYRVSHVVADLMGGHTAYEAHTATPGRSALVAAVGPVSNAVLAGAGVVLLDVVPAGVPSLLAGAFAWTNGVVAVFNLLPGLPLDGGFLLEAAVWGVTGRRHLGLVVAGWAGRVVAVAVVAWGLLRPIMLGARPSLITFVWVFLVASFLWRGASQAVAAGRLRRDLAGLRLAEVARPVRVLPVAARVGDLSTVALGPAPASVAGGGPDVVVLVDEAERAVGYVDPSALRAALADGDAEAGLEESMRAHPSSWHMRAPDEPDAVETVVAAMAARGLSTMVLVDDSGQVVGLVSAADIDDALARRPRR